MADDEATVEQTNQEDVEAPEEELSDEERALAELKESVEVEATDVGTLRRRLKITVPREFIDSRLNEELSEKRREEVIPGFRRGRAPLKLVQKRFGKELGNELTARTVVNAYLAVTERDEIKTVGDPLVLVTVPPPKGEKGEPSEKLLDPHEAIPHIKLPADGPLTFTCEVDLQPEFELPVLDGIPITRPSITVTDENVDREIRRVQGRKSFFAPVDAAEVIQADDLLICDLKVTAGQRPVKSEENAQLAARDMHYAGVPLEGLGEAVVGRRAGEVVTLTSRLPEDYPEVDLQNQPATVEIKVHDVKRLVVPPLDAEFLASLGLDSEQELRDVLRREMEAYIDTHVRRAMHAQIDAYLLEKTHLEIPVGISSRQTERVVALETIERLRQGVPEADITKEVDSLRTSAAEEVARTLKLNFILEKIAADRDITVTEEEVNGVIAEIARRRQMRFDRVRDDLIKSNQIDALYVRLRNERIRDTLVESAEISESSGDPGRDALGNPPPPAVRESRSPVERDELKGDSTAQLTDTGK